MVDNQNNYFNVVPDQYNPDLIDVLPSPRLNGSIKVETDPSGLNAFENRQATGSSFWMANIGHGTFPYAPSGYPVWRNVKAYGAVGDGVTDDTDAIMLAVTDGGRCGLDCGSTTVLGGIVFFPPGTYMVSKPIIQYYYSQFIGDPTGPLPTIKGMPTFEGIALVDVDPYIPGGNGAQWYINQNQFLRQIRNLRFDLTAMPNENQSGDQSYVPCGLHWQVAQLTSLQNVDFVMPLGGGTTAVGMFIENGSGGFMSDLTFFGGNIAMRVGSQQFTARRITITAAAIGISMIWDWGWTWQDLTVRSAWIAIQCTQFGGDGDQGTGSLTVMDSHFDSVPFAITVHPTNRPALVIDNLFIEGNTPSVVLVDGGETLLPGVTGGSATIRSWAMGRRYTNIDGSGETTMGSLQPNKPASLLGPNGKMFTRSKPQYEGLGAGSFVSVADFGATGDGTGDQSTAINAAIAAAAGRIVFFPSGVYPVESTVFVPPGTRIVGESWPQILGTGLLFSNQLDPQAVFRVGNKGDVGNVEISDLIFGIRGPAPGAVVVEWNIREASQGSAAMWDSHVRIGGSIGSDLQYEDCPEGTTQPSTCLAAALMMHVTEGSSGYFENVWLWTADHDLDIPAQSRINVFVARGLLVETDGPVWLWASASEHAVLYQYNFVNAANVFIGHLQTESPYFQPTPNSRNVFVPGHYAGDPTFEDCTPTSRLCLMSWHVMVQHSRDILLYGVGLYSWFQSYTQDCLIPENCQQRLMQTDFSEGIWMFNEYTKGGLEAVSPFGGIPPALQEDNRNGFLTAISAWLTLATTGADIG
ncbi:pectate lyase superfamily protein-domain-containing protein, partial [Stachybotrys elegans]